MIDTTNILQTLDDLDLLISLGGIVSEQERKHTRFMLLFYRWAIVNSTTQRAAVRAAWEFIEQLEKLSRLYHAE